jgi:HK97 family phage portal protein
MVAERVPEVIEKSQITVPTPGLPARFSLIGGSKQNLLLTHAKREQYAIYYEMFRQHPILRGAVEKLTKYAVSTGYHFEPDTPEGSVPKNKELTLRRFFRKSRSGHLLRLTYKDLIIYGEAFWWIEKSILGTPLRALRLHPKYMSPDLDSNDNLVGWTYGPQAGSDDKPKYYKKDRILHFRFDDPESDVSGLSLLHSLQITIATDLHAMHFNGNFFENSAQTGLIIIVRTSTGDEARRNREWLDQNYVGTKNAHRPLLLEGDVDVKPSVNRMTDMQYVEGRVLSRQEIMTALDIPPEKLHIVEDFRRPQQGGSSTDTFQSDTISPLQTIVEEEINDELIMEVFGWDDILFKHNESTSHAETSKAELYKHYEMMGVMSINQIAKKLGLPNVEGGDAHFIQTAAGLIPVEMIDEVANRLIVGEALPDPISGIGTTTTGTRNPPKATTTKEDKPKGSVND